MSQQQGQAYDDQQPPEEQRLQSALNRQQRLQDPSFQGNHDREAGEASSVRRQSRQDTVNPMNSGRGSNPLRQASAGSSRIPSQANRASFSGTETSFHAESAVVKSPSDANFSAMNAGDASTASSRSLAGTSAQASLAAWTSNPRPNSLAINNNNTPSNGSASTSTSERRTEQSPVASTPGSQEAAYNWQSTKKCVLERMSAIFNRETLADVHFMVGRGENTLKVPAHKFVLSIGSAVFDAMFNKKLANTEPVIPLPDVEPAAFLSLLKFLYTDEVSIGPETVMTTLYTAKKYAVPALENACVDFLKQNLSSDNAFMLLTQARLFDENALAQTCLDCIDKHSVDASEAEGFLDIDHETLLAVLERDTLRIREVALFNSVVRWSEAECLRQGLPVEPQFQRTVLGRALNRIRFPLMTIEEFASEVAQTGILTDTELVSLFLYFTVNPKPTVDFPDSPRSSITGKEYVVHRFGKTESRWGYSGTSDRIRFTVDRKIYLVGFALFGSFQGPSSYEVAIQLIHTPTGKVLASNDTSFQCNGSAETFRVQFKQPVEITANTNYTACATLKGCDSHYGTEGIKKVVVDLQGGKKATFVFQYAAGCNNGTSVEDGQIPELIFHI